MRLIYILCALNRLFNAALYIITFTLFINVQRNSLLPRWTRSGSAFKSSHAQSTRRGATQTGNKLSTHGTHQPAIPVHTAPPSSPTHPDRLTPTLLVTHPFIQSGIPSLIHPLRHSTIHPSNQRVNPSLIHPLIHSSRQPPATPPCSHPRTPFNTSSTQPDTFQCQTSTLPARHTHSPP